MNRLALLLLAAAVAACDSPRPSEIRAGGAPSLKRGQPDTLVPYEPPCSDTTAPVSDSVAFGGSCG